MPFSTRYDDGQAANRLLAGLIGAGVMTLFLVLDLAYVMVLWVHYGVWLTLLPLWWFMRRRLRRMAAGCRLAMDVVRE